MDQVCTSKDCVGTKIWSTPHLTHLNIEAFDLDLVESGPCIKKII